jgi:hypothetical protein
MPNCSESHLYPDMRKLASEIVQRGIEVRGHVNLSPGAARFARPRGSLGLLDLGQWPPVLGDGNLLARLKLFEQLSQPGLGFFESDAGQRLPPGFVVNANSTVEKAEGEHNPRDQSSR